METIPLISQTRDIRLPSPEDTEPGQEPPPPAPPTFRASNVAEETQEPAPKRRKLAQKKSKRRPRRKRSMELPACAAMENKIIRDATNLYFSLLPVFHECDFQFVCLQIETFEFDPKKITEIGVVIGARKENHFRFFGYHFLIQENLQLENGKQASESSKFKFIGKSEIVSLEVAMNDLLQFLHFGTLIISHCLESQLQLLRLNCQQEIVDFCLDPSLLKADTQTLFKAQARNQDCVQLETMLEAMRVQYDPDLLHNAGNDAIYTVAAFLQMMTPFKNSASAN